ncbi:MAG: prepilin-type N-terminal cleavage/methylation domain-containing protein [Candidatus Pacebacteria bacterium]|nr:prepilin-type N-terminal cleavage/methylation domain-containing protein [Candidatus Paceibacterota bacterium]
MNFKKGFTLIELLVVIAIIGILASIVLVSFPSATKKANDSRIMAAVSQANSQAAEFYTTDSTYTGYTINTNLASDIASKGGSPATGQLYIGTGGASYCIASKLNSGGVYCADSAGLIGKATATTSACATGCTTCACPAGTTL